MAAHLQRRDARRPAVAGVGGDIGTPPRAPSGPAAIAAAAAEGGQLFAHRTFRARPRAKPNAELILRMLQQTHWNRSENRRTPRHQLQGPSLQDQRRRPRQGVITCRAVRSMRRARNSSPLARSSSSWTASSKRAVRSQNYLHAQWWSKHGEWKDERHRPTAARCWKSRSSSAGKSAIRMLLGHTDEGTLCARLAGHRFRAFHAGVIDRVVSQRRATSS